MLIKDLKGKTVVGLFSGGLDSTTICHWLTSNGVKVISLTVDLGQPDEKSVGDIARRMKAAGAENAIMIDGKKLLAEYMMQVIQGLGHHEGGYMNTTGIARMATVQLALREMKDLGIDTLVHGATGRGNDQVRFELATAHLNPQKNVYAPWRDATFIKAFGGRTEMIKYCQKNNLKVSTTLSKPYSTDSNFCGLTHEAGKLESVELPPNYVKFLMGVSPKDAPDKEENVSIEFRRGQLASVNGQYKDNLLGAFELLNVIAGRNGVAIGIDVVENRRVGIKSRGVYESPGVSLTEIAYAKMLEFVLDRERRKTFDVLSRQWADIIYEGEFFSPKAGDIYSVISNIAESITGELVFGLYKGNVRFLKAIYLMNSLYDPERSSMEKGGDFNHIDSQGYLNVAAVTARAMHYAGLTRDTEA